MSEAPRHPPVPRALGRPGGFAAWGAEEGDVRVLFVGRGAEGVPEDRAGVLAAVAGEVSGDGAPQVAAARQVHGARVLTASGPGHQGDGDALVTDRRALALSVVTADCVPVLIAAGERVAAVHAGWRGVVAGVVPATVERLAAGGGDRAAWSAWIGPAIALCCYEVGPEVAERVAAASHPGVVVHGIVCGGSEPRPCVDLVAAVHHQLGAAGVERVAWLVSCTRCDRERLWSYRLDGAAAGRNHAFIWKR